MKRRNLIFGGAAALAAGAGVGVAWWRSTQTDAAQSLQLQAKEANQGASDGISSKEADFWQLSFETPTGQTLETRQFRGKPLIVNFWATWCPPCIEELPLLDYFYQENKVRNWQVLGLAVDQPSAVRQWLAARPLNFPVGMAGLRGTDLSKSMGNLSGGLPFSLVFGASGSVIHRKVGKVLPEDLAQWVQLK